MNPVKAAWLAIVVGFSIHTAMGASTEQPVYLPPNAMNVDTLFPPPVAGSAEEVAELALVRNVTESRTSEESARAKSEGRLTLEAFTSVVGPWFTAKNLPELNAFFQQLEKDSNFFVRPAKNLYRRPRPFVSDPALPALSHEKDGSYPSGHSTRGMMYATILSELMPELKSKLIARGEEIGWDRVIGGEHYPSDVIAGRYLGTALVRAGLKDDRFKAELEKVRAELNKIVLPSRATYKSTSASK